MFVKAIDIRIERENPAPFTLYILICLLFFAATTSAADTSEVDATIAAEKELRGLTAEREVLTNELAQYQLTLDVIADDEELPSESENDKIRQLAHDIMGMKKRLIAITEREVVLLQNKLSDAKTVAAIEEATMEARFNEVERAIESRPLRDSQDYSKEHEAKNVARLQGLLEDYYAKEERPPVELANTNELAAMEADRREALKHSIIPYNPDKVRLSGAEATTALGQITDRLQNDDLPALRRDTAPIFSITTKKFGVIIDSARRSLKPVGKYNYVAKINLQPGNTTLRIQQHRWEIRLPRDAAAMDYMVTLYRPPGGIPELHVFAIEDLLAEENASIPTWLPQDLLPVDASA